jgi:hypothetical protein
MEELGGFGLEFFRCGLPEVGDGPSSRGGYMMMNFDTSAQMHMGSRSGPSAGRNQQFASTVRPLLLAPPRLHLWFGLATSG